MDELDKRRRQRLLQISARFNNEVPALELLDHLSCITLKSTRQRIQKMEQREGDVSANRELCSSLTGRTGWYNELLTGLEAVDCHEIAELMRSDSRGSLCSFQPSSSSSSSSQTPPSVGNRHMTINAHSSTSDIPQRNQRHNTPITLPSVPVKRHVSMSTTVNDWPIGVRKALSVLDLPNEGRLSNNWEELAGLLDVTWEQSNRLERCSNPSTKIIDAWYEKHPDHATLGNLLQMLEELDRQDLISEVREVIGWEEKGAASKPCPNMYPADPDFNIEKFSQYNNNLFDGDEEPRTRSLPLDLKDQHKKITELNNKHASQSSSFRDGHQLCKKMNNKPRGCPDTLGMSSSPQDKMEKKQEIRDHDSPGKEIVGLPNATKEASAQDHSIENTQLADELCRGNVECPKGNSEFTKTAKDVQKKLCTLQQPATDKSLDWSKDDERLERRDRHDTWTESQRNQNNGQTGKICESKPESQLVRSRQMNGFQGSKPYVGLVKCTQKTASLQEMSKVNVETRKENSDLTTRSGSTSKTAHGDVSVSDKGGQVVGVQNDFGKKYPEFQPDQRTSNSNIMTADSKRGTVSINYPFGNEKQMNLKEQIILKELRHPLQVMSMPSQNSSEGMQDDISDSPAHTLVSLETMNVQSCDILESVEDPSQTNGESAKSTKVAENSHKEQSKERDQREMECLPGFVEDENPMGEGKVKKSPAPNVSEKKISQEPLHHDIENLEGRVGASEMLPFRSDLHSNTENVCNRWGTEKPRKDSLADKVNAIKQRMDHCEKREEMESGGQNIYGNNHGIHGNSQDSDSKIRKAEESMDRTGGTSEKGHSTNRGENVLITYNLIGQRVDSSHTKVDQSLTRQICSAVYQETNDLDQSAGVVLSTVSKNLLISKDFTMFERKHEDLSRDTSEVSSVVNNKQGAQQSDESKKDNLRMTGVMSQSQEVNELAASPMPLRSEESKESTHTTDWGHELVKGIASSLLCNFFGNNLTSS